MRVAFQQLGGLLGHDDQRSHHQEHRHEGEQQVADAADHRAAVAALMSFADITRWNTSCCGIEPSIIVIAAAKKDHVLRVRLEEAEHVLALRVVDHLVGAAGHVAAGHDGDDGQPTTSTIIWMKSVSATPTCHRTACRSRMERPRSPCPIRS